MSTAELFEILFSCVCAKGRSCRPSVQTPLTAVLKTDDISSGDECLQYFTVWREMHAVSCISGGQGGPPMEFGR